jgi:hypothetical protein
MCLPMQQGGLVTGLRWKDPTQPIRATDPVLYSDQGTELPESSDSRLLVMCFLASLSALFEDRVFPPSSSAEFITNGWIGVMFSQLTWPGKIFYPAISYVT